MVGRPVGVSSANYIFYCSAQIGVIDISILAAVVGLDFSRGRVASAILCGAVAAFCSWAYAFPWGFQTGLTFILEDLFSASSVEAPLRVGDRAV